MEQDAPAAEALYSKAVEDIYVFTAQSSNSCEYNLQQFREQVDTNLHLLIDQKKAQRKTCIRLSKEIKEALRDALKSIHPNLRHLLDPNVKGTQIHCKEISLHGEKLKVRATVEHPKRVVFVSIEDQQINVEDVPRTRR